MEVLRQWLIFLTICFIFEEVALEIPSIPNLDANTATFILVLSALILINILLIIASFRRGKSILYFVSINFQIAFVMCNMKTDHHAHGGDMNNKMVLKNACSSRLILMALQTSHLTSMAVKTEWIKFMCVNLINIIMFSIIIFNHFDVSVAGFWEVGQLGSIYASAIVSLIGYHFLAEKLVVLENNDKHFLRQQKQSFE